MKRVSMNRTQRRLRRAAVGGAVAVAAGLGPAAMASAVSQSPTASDPTADTFGIQATIEASNATDVGATDPSFAITKIDGDKHRIVIFRVGGAPSSLYDALPKQGIPIAFADAPRPHDETVAMLHAITSTSDALQAITGVSIYSAGTDFTGPINVGVSADSAFVESTLKSLLPAATSSLLRFRTESMPEGDVETRTNDNGANGYNSGDRVSTSVGSCTSGFGGRSAVDGADYFVMPWHCFQGITTTVIHNSAPIGSAGHFDQGHDLVLVKARTAPLMFRGATAGDNSTMNVVGSAHPTVAMGSLYPSFCASGATTYYRCTGYWKEYVSTRVHVDGYTDYFADEYCGIGNQLLWTGGDSGGPVGAPNASGGIVATSMVSTHELGTYMGNANGKFCGPDIQQQEVQSSMLLDLTTS